MFIFALVPRGPRYLLNKNAFVHSLLQEIQEEILQRQLEIASSVDFEKITKDFFEMNVDINTFLEESVAIGILIYVTWFSLHYFNDNKMKKLNEIFDYKKNRKNIRIIIFSFAYIFLRNIENAI
jgi:hypothetical protein